MGTCQTKTEEFSEFSDKFIEDFSQTHAYVSESHHPIHGPIQVWKKKNGGNYVMIISKNWRTEWEKEEFNEEINKRMKYDHPNLLRMLGWKKNFSDRVCSLTESYDLYAPLIQRTLAMELEKRGKCLEFFTESELWYIAQSLINVGTYFQVRGVFHGDFRPETIIIQEEDNFGSVMVVDNGLLANFASGYDRTWAESKEITVYLTPYLMSKLKHKVIKPIYNVYSADVFAIGMVLLYAATMRNPHRFYYNWADFSINKEAIERDLIGLQSKYTVSFLRLLRKMIDFDEKRATFLELGDNIYDYYHEESPNKSKDQTVPARLILNQAPDLPTKQDIEFRQPTKITIQNSPEHIKPFDESFHDFCIPQASNTTRLNTESTNVYMIKSFTQPVSQNFTYSSPEKLISPKNGMGTVRPNYYSSIAIREQPQTKEYYNETMTVRQEILDLERRVRDAIKTTEMSIKYAGNDA